MSDTASLATAPGGKRRSPTLVIALGGAAATLLYGLFVVGLRSGAPLVLFALGGFTLGLCGMALFRIVDPLVRPKMIAVRAEGARESVRLRELEHDKQLVLKAIREIEHDYQMRKIDEADYQEMTQRYRGRALRLIREIDAGDDFRSLIEQELKTRMVALASLSRRACSSCGAQNESDAAFCKKCGAALTPEPLRPTTP